ncbi:MAG: alkylphosphonate utilization protein [SAR324 cluster bacterium]|nr:alkylphosphonate utilization protein [SAR324 cluster bacterium]
MATTDCNGKELTDGDKVFTNKDLKVKGMPKTLKRGEMIKNIRLTGKEGEVECRIGKATIVLKTEFLKKG